MTRDQLQQFIVIAVTLQARRENLTDRISAASFGKEIHISITRDGDQTDRAFYRLTLHERKK